MIPVFTYRLMIGHTLQEALSCCLMIGHTHCENYWILPKIDHILAKNYQNHLTTYKGRQFLFSLYRGLYFLYAREEKAKKKDRRLS